MDPVKQTAFYLTESLIERLDKYAQELRSKQPGVRITRSDIVRLLLSRALEAEGTGPRK
jgi:hypothetical protein